MHKLSFLFVVILLLCEVDGFAQFTVNGNTGGTGSNNGNSDGNGQVISNDDNSTFGGGVDDYRKMSIRLGITAGADFSKLSSSDPTYNPNFGFAVGANGGILANFRFLKRGNSGSVDAGILAFQPEVRYNMMGAKVGDESLNLSYVTAGLMFQAYPIRDLFIELGGHYGYNIAHSPDELNMDSSTVVNLKDLKANDMFLAAGIGYSRKGFGIGVRYLLGMSPIAGNLKWKNNCIQVNLSYAFLLNKF